MPVRECASLNVLAGKSHMVAVIDERGKSEGLCGSPVDALALYDGLVPGCENLLELWVELFVLWKHRDLFAELCELSHWDAGVENVSVLLWVFDSIPLLGGPLLGLVSDGLALLVCLFESCPGL